MDIATSRCRARRRPRITVSNSRRLRRRLDRAVAQFTGWAELNRQTRPTACTAAPEYLAAGARRHTRAKAVLALPGLALRLPRSLWHRRVLRSVSDRSSIRSPLACGQRMAAWPSAHRGPLGARVQEAVPAVRLKHALHVGLGLGEVDGVDVAVRRRATRGGPASGRRCPGRRCRRRGLPACRPQTFPTASRGSGRRSATKSPRAAGRAGSMGRRATTRSPHPSAGSPALSPARQRETPRAARRPIPAARARPAVAAAGPRLQPHERC